MSCDYYKQKTSQQKYTKMNPDLQQSFSLIKPYCDAVMKKPTIDKLKAMVIQLPKLNDDVLQEMHLYILFPVFTHMRSKNLKNKYALLHQLAEVMRLVLEQVTLNSTEVFLKYHSALLNLIYDKTKPGIVAEIPEELKLSLIQCFMLLMLNIEPALRSELFKNHVPLMAQTVFISVHVAKLDKLRLLRLTSIHCVEAYTATHPQIMEKFAIIDKKLEEAATDFLAGVLPGVLAALQDVAVDKENPGHVVVTAAINAIHRIVCLVMDEKNLPEAAVVSDEDFSRLVREKQRSAEVAKKLRDIPKKSPEWYKMSASKLRNVTESLSSLQTHENVTVRRELAVYCSRVLFECSRTMQPSIGTALDVLIAFCRDPYPEVSTFATRGIIIYFDAVSRDRNEQAFDSLAERMQASLLALPRILNNIEMERKISSLNLLQGYISILSSSSRFMSCVAGRGAATLCRSLLEAASIQPSAGILTRSAERGITTQHSQTSPWGSLVHLDAPAEAALRDVCLELGDSEGAGLIVDELLTGDDAASYWLLNCIGSAPNIDPEVSKQILNKYIEESVWNLPFEVAVVPAHSSGETSTWKKDSVPGLYEGTTETRYTDISYSTPRPPRANDPTVCSTLAAAEANVLAACLLAEGVGQMAKRLGKEFQPFLLKTLCLVLERVGSDYEMLHLAGAQAIKDIACAGGHPAVAELIRANADYFTYQVTTRLKKAWQSKSALQILTVVLEYGDASILTCIYGIVSDVLVKSCDRYHGNDLSSYLRVFLTFVVCILKWFPPEIDKKREEPCACTMVNLFQDTEEFVKAQNEAERLVEEESVKSAEELFKEDQQRKEDEELDYDDTVSEEKPPTPQHITLTITILRRCLNFIPSKRRQEKLLSLIVIKEGIKILANFENELLPLVHQIWGPLVGRFGESEPVVLRHAFEVLVTIAALAKDFVRHRTVKEVLPNLFKFIKQSAKESRLKDVGSYYRQTQAFKLQVAALTALPDLAIDLGLEDEVLKEAFDCIAPYLSNKQPKPLQALAVGFYQAMLYHDSGATWAYFRAFCRNPHELWPPAGPPAPKMRLEAIIGSPFDAEPEFSGNVELVFGGF